LTLTFRGKKEKRDPVIWVGGREEREFVEEGANFIREGEKGGRVGLWPPEEQKVNKENEKPYPLLLWEGREKGEDNPLLRRWRKEHKIKRRRSVCVCPEKGRTRWAFLPWERVERGEGRKPETQAVSFGDEREGSHRTFRAGAQRGSWWGGPCSIAPNLNKA